MITEEYLDSFMEGLTLGENAPKGVVLIMENEKGVTIKKMGQFDSKILWANELELWFFLQKMPLGISALRYVWVRFILWVRKIK